MELFSLNSDNRQKALEKLGIAGISGGVFVVDEYDRHKSALNSIGTASVVYHGVLVCFSRLFLVIVVGVSFSLVFLVEDFQKITYHLNKHVFGTQTICA